MKYIKPLSTVNGVQGFVSADGYAVSVQDAPIYRAGEKVRETVQLLGWTIPAGALISIAGDVLLDGDVTAPLCLGKDIVVNYQSSQIEYILDCDYQSFYAAVAGKVTGYNLYIQYRIVWTDDFGAQESKIIALGRAMPAVTGTGAAAAAAPGTATLEDVASAFAQSNAYADGQIDIHNDDVTAHPSILQALSAKVDVAALFTGDVIKAELMPGIAITRPQVKSSEEEMLELTDVQMGDVVKRSDLGCSFILSDGSPSLLASWIRVVDSVGVGNGSVWLNGLSDPLSATGDDGYYFMNNASGDYFQKISGAWTLIGNLVGPPGPQGKSAYQVAVDNGFVGDVAAWLASLQGEDGSPGISASETNTFTAKQTIDLPEDGTALSVKQATGETIRLKSGGQAFFAAGAILAGANLATDATDGFCHIPTCYGTPTGNPVAHAGTTPLVFDSYYQRLYYHDATGWKPVAVAVRCETYVVMDPATAYAKSAKIPIMRTSVRPISIGYIEVSVDGTVNQVVGNLRYADDLITFANATTVDIFDSTSGTGQRADGNIASPDVPAGKWLYLDFTAAPNAAIKYMAISISWTE